MSTLREADVDRPDVVLQAREAARPRRDGVCVPALLQVDGVDALREVRVAGGLVRARGGAVEGGPLRRRRAAPERLAEGVADVGEAAVVGVVVGPVERDSGGVGTRRRGWGSTQGPERKTLFFLLSLELRFRCFFVKKSGVHSFI